MSGLEMMGMGAVAAAGIGIGLVNAPKPPRLLDLPMPRHERAFAERELAADDVPAHDASAEQTLDADGLEMSCGGG